MFLARKITRAKWKTREELSAGEISADAVTADLKTQGNALSFWQCHTATNSDVEEAALAIAAARDRVARLDVVWLEHFRSRLTCIRNHEIAVLCELVPR